MEAQEIPEAGGTWLPEGPSTAGRTQGSAVRLIVSIVLLATAGCATPRPAAIDIPVGCELSDGTIITQTEGEGQ